MRIPSFNELAFGVVGATLLVLLGIGGPQQVAPPPLVETSPPPGPSQVSAGGMTLTSTSVDFPDDSTPFPDGPHAAVFIANCASCHSASMAFSQPPLSAAQWIDEVAKMRDVYKAPIAAADVPAIVAYLSAMSAKLTLGTPTRNIQKIEPAAGQASGGTG
ncbi:hypothetical protein KZX46_00485 (plasmid) [Polymorphobacter sp. PAMC 29334]|uniref:hypothetical protein n=1 Tax=Polymorphobacter sp. PAMC 29334 TaxID=2862331 RepID=UPI001C741D8B|nr:hypothetical protein [Polymorphobacter sp. PAMC 29334]QYE33320.1 hypothetical protein KZX46_00485 [Polymorphobacter sp. PAMC 29334]